MLELVGLAAQARGRVGTYSLGMRQRLGIAAALLGDPPVLVLDEPVNGLDPDGVRWIRTLMRPWASEGRTVLVSSHLLSEMQDTADHLLVVSHGRLVADAPVADLVASPALAAVRVRTPQPDQLTRQLSAAGATVEPAGPDALMVNGMDAGKIGDLALQANVALHVLLAKTLVAAIGAAILGLALSGVGLAVSVPILGRAGAFTTLDLLRATVGTAVYLAMTAALTAGIAAIARQTVVPLTLPPVGAEIRKECLQLAGRPEDVKLGHTGVGGHLLN